MEKDTPLGTVDEMNFTTGRTCETDTQPMDGQSLKSQNRSLLTNGGMAGAPT